MLAKNNWIKIITGKIQITKEFSCDKEIKNKVINKICALLKNISYNFEPIMYSVIGFDHCQHRSQFLLHNYHCPIQYRHLNSSRHRLFYVDFNVPGCLASW